MARVCEFCWFLILLRYQVTDQIKLTSKYGGKTVIGLVGSSVNFTWSLSGDVRVVHWGLKKDAVNDFVTNGKLISLQKTGPVSVPVPSAYNGRVSGSGNASSGRVIFTLSQIKTSDEAFYGCQIKPSNNFEDDDFDSVYLAVKGVPQISISTQPTYNEGSSVNISCTASGPPDPDVQWISNGTVKSSGKKTAFLVFSRINRTDDGQYTCKANNSAGNDEKHTAIVIHYKPEGTKLNTADNTVTQGDSVTFTCHVTAAKPQVSRYRFYLNDTTLVKDSNDSQYTINNVQRSQHYGKYKCIPSNDVGDGLGATVILNVNIPVQFTVLPENLTVNETNPIVLSCDASGFPKPSFTWKKDGQVLSVSKQLRIQMSHRNDTGIYMCTASNGQRKTVKGFVTVQYPPSIKEATSSTDKSWIGQTVTLKCLSDGVPTPTLTWYKPDGSQINSVTATQNTVTVKMDVDGDFSAYKCVADNELTPADSKIVKIEQIKEPGSPTIVHLDIQATSLTVKWTAPADDGGSPITAYRLVILKDGTEIKIVNITDPGTTSWTAGELKNDTEYRLKVFARNAVFEGVAVGKVVKTKLEGVPAAATIDKLPKEIAGDTITLKWSKPKNNGKVITQYTVYQRIVTAGEPGEWIKLKAITDVSVRELKVELEKGKVYEFVVTATNDHGESLKEDGKIARVVAPKGEPGGGGGDGTQTGGGEDSNGMGAAVYAGAAAAGVLLIIGSIVIFVLWRRRKPSSDEDTSRDELGSANPYESEDGYHCVSQEAAQSLQVSGPAVEPNYALVDQSRKKKNRMPANEEYAQVDKSKKTKKKKKKPDELDYADLEDLRADIQLGPVPSGGAAAAAPIVRPPAYEGTEYADISQFGVPRPDPTYANVPKQEVVYSNVESM